MINEDNIIIVALVISGLVFIIVSFVTAMILKRYVPHFPLPALLVLSGFPLPIGLEIAAYATADTNQDIIEWYATQSLADIGTSACLTLVGVLTAWLVLKRRVEAIDVDAFK